jgi:Xaa-Pro aminopeptidase
MFTDVVCMMFRADAASCAQVNTAAMLLIDSGAHYEDGTTDVTRTVHFGVPTEHEVRRYVLFDLS